MRQHTLLVLLLAGAGCASPPTVPAPGFGYFADETPMRTIVESPHVAPPVNDISEADRRAWYEAHLPKVQPEPVDRLALPESESSSYCSPWYPGYWLGGLLPSISVGWWGGHGHGGHHGSGWGWGLGWNSGGWCW